MPNSIILIFAIVFLVVLAGLFAGAETGIYRLSRLRLRLGIEQKRLSFVLLGRSLRDSPGLLISMLAGTNLSYYLATSIVTFFLLGKVESEHTAELFATVMTAPVLFVFSELIPKNIFFYRADSVMPCVGPVLFAFHKLFTWCGIVPLLKFVSRIFGRLTGLPTLSETAAAAVVHQPHIKAIFHATREESFLSPVQTYIIKRVANISHLGIKSVMTPLSRVQTVELNCDRAALLDKLKKYAFTRLPVYEGSATNIVGFINIYDCLSSPEQFSGLHNFVKPIRKLGADTIVTEAIKVMQSENQKIVLVMRTGPGGRDRPIGIVTMKDLVEELLGELTEW